MGNCAILWNSKKQAIFIILSSCESKYVATTSCTWHASWLRRLLKKLHMPEEEATKICIDNKFSQALAKNLGVNQAHVHTISFY